MKKSIATVAVLVGLFLLTSLSGCVRSSAPTTTSSPAAETPDSKPTASAAQPSSAAVTASGNETDPTVQASEEDNTDNETINTDDIKADFYYEYLIVETYVKARITAVNYNNFGSLQEYLDDKSDIFVSEKQYVKDYVSKGIQLEMIRFVSEDLKVVSENLYDVYYSIEFEELGSNNTKTLKKIRQVFTVFDDGNIIKITDIKDYTDPPVAETPVDFRGVTIGEGGTFYLGQSFDDVIEKLGELGIDDYSQIEITNEPEAWNWGDTVIGSGVAAFSIDVTVYTIRVDWNSGISTAEGLKAGDTLDKMKELYGTEYTTYAYGDSGTVYEFAIGDHYFQVFAGNEDNLVHEWGISIYKYDK